MPVQKPKDDEAEEYVLSDLAVSSVGLVTRGAVTLGDEVGKNFFLLKSQEATMADELVIEEVADESLVETPDDIQTEEVPAGFMKWFTGLFKADKQPASKKEKMAAKLKALMDELGDDEEPDGDEAAPLKGQKVGKSMNEETVAVLVKAQVEAMQAAWTAEREALVKSARREVENQYQAKITDLESRVGKAEVEKAAEVENRVKREFVEKAQGLMALPLAYTETGDLLYKASKSLSTEDYTKLESLLKATNSMLGVSQIFQEFGYTGSTLEVSLDDKVKSIAKSQNLPYDEAMLQLPKHEQLQLLGEMRGGA